MIGLGYMPRDREGEEVALVNIGVSWLGFGDELHLALLAVSCLDCVLPKED